ncbi:DUF262 domain-containing protein [Clostridium perfringens]|uniref:DUF262 domain-containing protein n=1 Tax=Clostridium perfringens TaxID=1502 RepID=UPI001FACE37C|nr:DUF262 domain-containing protein [Clostridium perfringens]MDK0624665.1 DUF262 domain-containing protein [Clostridium perfringens]MDM0856509.1 DUF262 domain-containing protein [Clostridium perfringens]
MISNDSSMNLQREIDNKSKEIKTDGYPMSIGELINLYKDEELEIHPEFQRVFRWNDNQKTKFIESILLGIPIPPIFVSQREDGVWDVVDGLQRLSTIFEFVGILKNEQGKLTPPSVLRGTKFLPSLKNKVWDNTYDEDNSFTKEQRIKFKRQKLDVKIIKDDSYKDAKYELFQRINTAGSQLTDQELRNCLIIMLDTAFYDWLDKLRKNENFQACIPLTEKQYLEQYDMEILVRFFVYKNVDINNIMGNEDMGDFITDNIVLLIEENKLDLEEEEKTFIETFKILNKLFDENAFRKYDEISNKYKGAFSLSLFEIISMAISRNIDSIKELNDNEIIEKIKNISKSQKFLDLTTGTKRPRPIVRFKELRKLGEELF